MDGATNTHGLRLHAVGQAPDHGRVLLVGERLGQEPEGADGRLQLVAHVGYEVTPHGLEPLAVRYVLDDGDAADRAVPVGEGDGADLEVAAGRAVEVDGSRVRLAVLGGGLEDVADGLLGKGLGVAGAGERLGEQVAVDDPALLVAEHDALVQGVEGLSQTLGRARASVETQSRLVSRPFHRAYGGLEALAVRERGVRVSQPCGEHAHPTSHGTTRNPTTFHFFCGPDRY